MAAPRTLHTKAIVLDTTKLAEQDLIITAIAADGQMRRAVAKGARKPGGRLASRCDLFCESDLLLAQGRGPLMIVSEASLIDPHLKLREDYAKCAAASAAAELAEKSCFEDMPDPFLHAILSAALTALEAADAAHESLIVAAYGMKVLAHEGWRPELESCLACQDPHPTFFSAKAGGMLCSSCAREIAGAHEVAPAEILWLKALIGETFQGLLAEAIDAAEAARLLALSHEWCQTHLEARLRAWEFMRGL